MRQRCECAMNYIFFHTQSNIGMGIWLQHNIHEICPYGWWFSSTSISYSYDSFACFELCAASIRVPIVFAALAFCHACTEARRQTILFSFTLCLFVIVTMPTILHQKENDWLHRSQPISHGTNRNHPHLPTIIIWYVKLNLAFYSPHKCSTIFHVCGVSLVPVGNAYYNFRCRRRR